MKRLNMPMTDYECLHCGKWTDQGQVWHKPMILPADPEYDIYGPEFIPGHMIFAHPKCHALAMMNMETRMRGLGIDISKATDEAIRKVPAR